MDPYSFHASNIIRIKKEELTIELIDKKNQKDGNVENQKDGNQENQKDGNQENSREKEIKE